MMYNIYVEIKEALYKIMKNRSYRNLVIIALYSFALTILTVVVRTVLLLTSYDSALGYFRSGFSQIFLSVLLLLGLVCGSAPLLLIKKGDLEKNRKGLLFVPANVTAAVMFLGCGTALLIKSAVTSTIIGIVAGFLSIVASFYFLIKIAATMPKYQAQALRLRPWFNIVLIFALMLILTTSYFDMTININGPFTSVLQFSLLASAVFCLGELRYDVGRPLPRAHLSAALIALFLTASTAVGNLAFCFFGNAGKGHSLSDPISALLLLALAFFLFAETTAFYSKNHEV